MLRFVLQSTLKLQVTAATVIVYDKYTMKEINEPTSRVQIAIAASIIALLNLFPFIFAFIVWSNRSTLDKLEVRDKIGTLYNGLKPKDRTVALYSFIFLVRRSLFIAITFALFEHPGLQLLLMLQKTLFYIIYLGYADFFKIFGTKVLEIFNESVFILIQYLFIVL